jgi:tetratricopeptide (TPR) repeat protein
VTSSEFGPDEAVHRVVTLMDLGREAEALAEAERALGAFPDDAYLHALRGSLLIDLDRPREAVAAAEYAISLEPQLWYAHTVRACALLARGKVGGRRDRDPEGAVRSASEGARLGDDPWATYTLVRALLARRDRRAAEQAARTLQAEWPASALAPLALALVHLSRAGVLHREWRVNGWRFLLLVLVTRGGVLLVALVIWAVRSVRRAPHLGRADRYLHEALALQPNDPNLHALAADVLRMRFRFPRAVDYEVTAGALDAGLLEAEEVVAGVSRRLTLAVLVALFSWMITDRKSVV